VVLSAAKQKELEVVNLSGRGTYESPRRYPYRKGLFEWGVPQEIQHRRTPRHTWRKFDESRIEVLQGNSAPGERPLNSEMGTIKESIKFKRVKLTEAKLRWQETKEVQNVKKKLDSCIESQGGGA